MMKPTRDLVITSCCLAAAALSALPARAQTLDGRVQDAEWAGARIHEMGGGGSVRVIARDGRLHLGIRGPSAGIAHACVASGDEVHVLHVSAAVGRARYARAGDGWTLDSEFEWALRDPSLTGAAVQAREDYLEREGWVGTISRMGNQTDREMIIDLAHFRGPLRVAVGYLTLSDDGSAGAVSRWPDVADDCSNARAIAGFLPESARLSVTEWIELP